MANYIAIIHKDADSDYGVSFPDFPGCVTAGCSVDEAKDMAQEALSGHVHYMREDGDKIPSPSSLESIIGNSEYAGAIAYIIITLPDEDHKTVRFNATLPKPLLDALDKKANELHMSRSGLLAQAIRDSIIQAKAV